MTVEGPLVAFALRRPPDDALRSLLVALTRWCAPAMFERAHAAAFKAVIVDDVDAVGIASTSLPHAVWLAGDGDLLAVQRTVDDAAIAVVMSPTREVVDAAGAKGAFVPLTPARFGGVRPMPAFVRGRLRRARHLPADAIASFGVEHAGLSWCGDVADLDLIDTAFASAAAVAVVGPEVVRALAWAAPTVTDPTTAHELGLRADVDVVVADRHEMAARTRELAADDARSATFSRAGRAFYEAQCDLECAAAHIARRLDLLPPRRARVTALVDELGGPRDARSAERALELVEGLP